MECHITLDRTVVPANVDSTVHLMIELTAPPAVAASRAPIDVVVVLDRSGSMSGQPLQAVREATCSLLRLLGPDDRIGVVAFDDTVDLVLPLGAHRSDAASARIRQITSGGSTNLSGGWLKGLETLSTGGRADALRRIVMLTDGHANTGITDTDALCSLVAGAKVHGVTTTTVGFADGYDEVLLAALADAGAGNDYWCAGADQAARVFATEFGGLAAVVAQNISIEIVPRPGIEITVLNDYPITVVTGGLQVVLGDAYGSERRRIVAGMGLLATMSEGAMNVAELVVRWASTVGSMGLRSATIPVTVTSSTGPDADQSPDPDVMDHVNVLLAARAQKLAHQHIGRGDTDAARRALSETISLLAPMPAQAAGAAQARRDLDELEGGRWSAASSKRLHAAMRSTQKGRKARFDGDDAPPT